MLRHIPLSKPVALASVRCVLPANDDAAVDMTTGLGQHRDRNSVVSLGGRVMRSVIGLLKAFEPAY